MNKPTALKFVKLISIFELLKGLAGLIYSIAFFALAINTVETAFADAFTMVFIGLVVFIFSSLYLVAAASLWKLRGWSRIYIIAMIVISLLSFPTGNLGAFDSYMATAIILASINLLFIYLLGFNKDVRALF